MTKNIVITGAASGLGEMITNIMAMNSFGFFEGANIYSIDIQNHDDVDVIPVTKVQIHNLKFDFTNNSELAYDHLVSKLPDNIDILINNVGVNYIEWIDKIDMQQYDDLFSINVRTMVMLVKKLAERMRGGTILNIVSNASDMAMTNSLAYNGSKGAQKIMTKQMARELGKTHDITVFGVSPNKLANTMMSRYIDGKVCELRGWTREEAQKYQVSSLPCGVETDKETLAEFITFLLSRKERHRYLQGCIIPYGAPMSN